MTLPDDDETSKLTLRLPGHRTATRALTPASTDVHVQLTKRRPRPQPKPTGPAPFRAN